MSGGPPTPAERAALAAALEQEEARVRRLEKERADATGAHHGRPQATQPRTPAEKVKLFRLLFRGRDDLYPTRFVSKKTGKPGYAPACSNKFVAGVCELPEVKCGDCTNQALRPVDDAAVLGHLRGKHVMDVYLK